MDGGKPVIDGGEALYELGRGSPSIQFIRSYSVEHAHTSIRIAT